MRWTYDELMALPVDVYGVLLDQLTEEAQQQRER